MKSLVLDLIESYDHRLSTVESLVSNTYETTASSEDAFENMRHVQDEGERLIVSLRETLARNCHLRRRDFDLLTERILGNVQATKQIMEEERAQIREHLACYLRIQKGLIRLLRERLGGFVSGDCTRDDLEATLDEIKNNCLDEGTRVFTQLSSFQQKAGTHRREQELLNNRMQRLLERGQQITLEDLRQIKAVRVQEERKNDRQTRRGDVERLLAHFKEKRSSAVRVNARQP